MNDNIKRKEAEIFLRRGVPCELWESETVLQTEEKLKDLLLRISKQLSDVAELIDKLPPRG